MTDLAPDDPFDLLVTGAGRCGLTAALAARRATPDARIAILEALPQPGGSTRTQRTNGFACELGAFAYARKELDPLLALLPQPPVPIEALAAGRTGWSWDGTALAPVEVTATPWSFRSGNEELAQACRRALGPALRLGRAVVAVRAHGGGFEVDLAGEVPTTLHTRELHLCTPTDVAARWLGALDPGLVAAERIRREPRAFVFCGGYQRDLPELTGYGVLPVAGEDHILAEAIFCSHVFPGRALPGQLLVRLEVHGPALDGDDAAVLQAALAELRRWTGCGDQFGLTKVHRFTEEVGDGALVECRTRVRGLAARVPGLRWR